MKRLFDLLFATIGLILLAPIFLVIACAIKMDSAGPVFFRQVRVGRHGSNFRIFKFRTMVQNSTAQGPLVTVGQDPRITRAGRFLRRVKLDELPQLFNIVEGAMSLVGPRPEVPSFIQFYTIEQREVILSVRPGITDFAAIEFREESTLLANSTDPRLTYINDIMPRKYELYARYIREKSLLLDTLLIFRTIGLLFARITPVNDLPHRGASL